MKNDKIPINKSEFLISEYQQTHAYFINVEKSMLDLLKLYNFVLSLLVPISAVLFRIFDTMHYFFVSALSFVFFLLGLYILGMYLELRVRKIKTLEQIAVFREKLIAADESFSEFLRMITSIKDCPPYLRRPSSEWYTVVYITFLNGIAFAFFLCFGLVALNLLGIVSSLMFIALPLITFEVWIGLFLWATGYCYRYDLKREKEYQVKNEYTFLDPKPYFPAVFKPLRWCAEKHENTIRRSYSREENISDEQNLVEDCELCRCIQTKEDVAFADDHFYCKWDKYPVSSGHLLIIPKRHVHSFFDLTPEELMFFHKSLLKAQDIIGEKHKPNGYNVGVNVGSDAGQTIPHVHIHVIPRYRGDAKEPEGGIRNVIPGKGKYR